ncbi:type III secretion system needle filament subunit SctF [Escherichia albertii]|uniref:type III secretion system needle filament subunit SctF n=1 Tax=Escherichia albertii TaxID=208962 RepID=UPI0010F560FE|nr:type III secretion system needle filament subunit SctF [Escherichia albertii]
MSTYTDPFLDPTHSTVSNPDWHDDYMTNMSEGFQEGTADMQQALDDALLALQQDPSNPGYLAAYQTALSEYTLFRNAQSNVTKSFRDIDQAIISNFK